MRILQCLLTLLKPCSYLRPRIFSPHAAYRLRQPRDALMSDPPVRYSPHPPSSSYITFAATILIRYTSNTAVVAPPFTTITHQGSTYAPLSEMTTLCSSHNHPPPDWIQKHLNPHHPLRHHCKISPLHHIRLDDSQGPTRCDSSRYMQKASVAAEDSKGLFREK